MEFPFVLLALLALPFVVAAVIVAVSSVRRRRQVAAGEPVHRLQSDAAAVQDAAVYPEAPARRISSGRERRADEAAGRADR